MINFIKENKVISVFIIFAVLFFSANIAYSSGYHQEPDVVNNTTINLHGIASSIAASQHQFYWGTDSWQGSVGIGAHDATTAFSFGMAKRFNKTLINGNITQEEGKFGGGVGVNFLF